MFQCLIKVITVEFDTGSFTSSLWLTWICYYWSPILLVLYNVILLFCSNKASLVISSKLYLSFWLHFPLWYNLYLFCAVITKYYGCGNAQSEINLFSIVLVVGKSRLRYESVVRLLSASRMVQKGGALRPHLAESRSQKRNEFWKIFRVP
jgi:hypothetical protein